MTAEEMTRELDALELEELAGMIIAALEGKQSAEVQLPETGENARSRHDDGGEVQLLLRALSGGAQSEAQPGLSAPGEEFLKPLDDAAAETDFSVSVSSARKEGGFAHGERVGFAADRRGMESISDFFMRDSRRYDSGFERY